MVHSFDLHHQVPYKREEVLQLLRDFSAFARFHPLMEKVETIDATHFITHEFLPLFLGLKFRFAYEVTVTFNEGQVDVVYRARPQGIGMEFSFTISSEPGSKTTKVKESVQLTGPFLVFGFTERAIRKSHTELFATYSAAAR